MEACKPFGADENFSPPNTVLVKNYLRTRLGDISNYTVAGQCLMDTPEAHTPEWAAAPVADTYEHCRENENATLLEQGYRNAGVGKKQDDVAPQAAGTALQELVLWHSPALSSLVFLLGCVLICAVDFLLRGNHSVTLLGAVATVCTMDLALNFTRSLISARWRDRAAWAGSSLVLSAATIASQAVHRLALLHDRYLSAREPRLTLKVAGGLWALSFLASILSIWRLISLAFVLAFTVPVAYDMYHQHVEKACMTAVTIMKERWDSLGVSRKQKLALLAVFVIGLWLQCGWGNRLRALFLAAIAIRCNLKPSEVDAIVATAEPYTQSVKKRARRLSMAASDFARRNLGPSKHHHR